MQQHILDRLQTKGRNFFRQASKADYPYKAKTAPFICICGDGRIFYAQSKADKYEMLIKKKEEDIILSVWPGQWSSDVFIIDDIEKTKSSLY